MDAKAQLCRTCEGYQRDPVANRRETTDNDKWPWHRPREWCPYGCGTRITDSNWPTHQTHCLHKRWREEGGLTPPDTPEQR